VKASTQMARSRARAWLRAQLSVLLIPAALLVLLVLGQLIYHWLGPTLVAAAYRGESSIAVLNEAIRGRDVYPLEKYLLEADLQSARFFADAWRWFLGVAALTLVFAAGRPWSRRKLSVLLALGGGALLLALIVTRVRFEAEDFERSVESKLARNQALAEKAERVGRADLRRLPDLPRNGYYFLVDEHLDRLRVEATAQASRELGQSAPIAALEFNQEGELEPGASGEARLADGVLHWRDRAGGRLRSRELDLAIGDLGRLEIRMRVRNATKARLILITDAFSDVPSRTRPIVIDTVPGSEFQAYSVDLRGLRRNSRPEEVIDRFELLPSDVADDVVEIDHIRFFHDRQAFEQVPVGATWETIAGEGRKVIHAWTGFRLSVDLELPAQPVALSLGAAVLDSGAPVRFTVEARSAGERKELWSREVTQNAAWVDARLDLGAYAGRALELVFETASAEANVAFWSNPVLWSEPRERLNVVVLLEDALRADRLGTYGYSRPTSPHRDRFASSGAVFEHAFSQETKTRPSVPSVMTSLYPTATGVWFFSDVLDDGYTTLAEVMRRSGFATASFVQNPNAGIYAGLEQGFDTVEDNRTLGARADDLFRRRVDRWLETWSGRNTFMYLHVIDPHGPYDPPPPFERWYREAPSGDDLVPELLEIDPEWMERPTASGRRNLYDGEIQYNDEQFGLLLELLAARGLLDDTLFVLIADHGERLGEDDVWGHQPPGYVEGIHVPLFMVHPGRIPAGQRIAEPVQLLDVMPTILELVGVDASDLVLQGDSLAPLLSGERSPEWRDRVVISEEVLDRARDEEEPWGSIFFRDWQLIRSKSFDGLLPAALRRAPRWVPDLGALTRAFRYTERDPPRRQYWSFHADWPLLGVARRALYELERQDRRIRDAFRSGETKAIELDPEVQERLRALGYLK
jgi:arylsulfatase A-like enzyme